MLRGALGAALARSGFAVVASAADAADPVVRAEAPDVLVVVDPEPSAELVGTRCVAVVTGGDVVRMTDLIASGADGVLADDRTVEAIAAAAVAVAGGHAILDPRAASIVVAGWRSTRQGDRRAARLTTREREVLVRLAEGRSVKEIAVELGVTPKTIEHQKTSLFRRLDVATQSEAVARGISLGLLAEP